MSDNLTTYLHDHLAGATAGLELVEALRDQHADEPLGRFAAQLSGGIQADRRTLEELAERVGAGGNPLPQDPRLSGLEFVELSRRAQAQHGRVEGQRLSTARTALRPAVE